MNMTKIFRMKNLDCANCAAKMERAIQKLDGVQAASVNFMAQKLTLECEAERLPELVEQIKKAIAKVDPDCTIVG